ncbi:SAM-dependent methyltransferase, partial [Escherichia coli]|uniref:SAM-dependent methyltransferase n=1 Tax=Escherichia coli TaxID=562 RepID=UPI003F447542
VVEAGAGPAPLWTGALEEWPGPAGGPGLFFANELLDAFPVDRWRFDGSAWRRLVVTLDPAGRGFEWGLERTPWAAPEGMEGG